MAYSTLAHPQLCAPTVGSVELAVPAATAAWTPIDWVTLESGIAESILAGVAIRPTVIGGFFDGITAAKVEIGVDDGTPRSVYAWPIFAVSTLSQSGGDNGLYLPLSIGLDDIPEGCDLLARISTDGAGFDHVYQIAASYLQKPLASSWLTSAQPQFCLPDAAAAFSITSPGTYTESTPVVARASGPAAILTFIAMWSTTATVGEIILDVYADDVLVHTEYGNYGGGKFGLHFSRPLKSPLNAFPLDSEITLVARSDIATTANVYLGMVATPL